MKSFGRKVSVLSFCSKLSARNISNNVETMQRRVQRQGRQVSSVKLQVGLDSDTGAKLDVRQQNETEVWKKWTKNLKNEQEKSKETKMTPKTYCTALALYCTVLSVLYCTDLLRVAMVLCLLVMTAMVATTR